MKFHTMTTYPAGTFRILRKNGLHLLLTWIVLFVLSASHAQHNAATVQPVKTGYADVNGLHMYYEIYGKAGGKGEPLILLHGGFGNTGIFASIMPALSGKRQVIAVDLQAHGRTADIDRPMTFETMSDDIVALIKFFKLSTADIMGYSVGGNVALYTVMKHPEVVRKGIIVSAPFKRKGEYADLLAQQDQMGPQAAESMKQLPVYPAYAKIAPRPADWPRLVTKMAQLIQKDYDWSGDVKNIKTPMLLICGDADMFPPSHAAEFFALLGGGQKDAGWDGKARPQSQLAILPNTTHYNIFMNPELATAANKFLESK
jgi:pimeloyl-ACP methyl ester carboxylesterase